MGVLQINYRLYLCQEEMNVVEKIPSNGFKIFYKDNEQNITIFMRKHKTNVTIK